MRPDALLHPVGPLPASAYWLRRGVVLGGLFAAVVILVLIVTGLGGSGGSGGSKPTLAQQSPSPSTDQTASGQPGSTTQVPPATPGPTGASSPAPVVTTCTAAQLTVAISTPATSYPAGSLPQLMVSVTNTGATACATDVGAKMRTLTITSGSDRVWSSADCGTSASDPRTLRPKETITLTNAWDRRRSEPGCASTPPAGQLAATGVYVATVKLGQTTSPQGAVFCIS